MRTQNPLVVALDVGELDAAEDLARRLTGEIGLFKVGFELFCAHGPAAVRTVAAYGPVLLDLKLHDIPTTVGRAARRLGELGVAMLTIHALGGSAMVAAAVEGLAEGAEAAGHPPAQVAAVTLLTSLDDDGRGGGLVGPARRVEDLARLAVAAGATAVVCPPGRLTSVRTAVGDSVALVTPGIRPSGAPADDHAETLTPVAALRAGADLVVVGRPITGATDPVAAARSLLRH